MDPFEAERLFRDGVALFNGARYWHAHEAWETLWRAAEDKDRDYYQGLIQIAAGLLHLQRRNLRGARNKLSESVRRRRVQDEARRVLAMQPIVLDEEAIELLEATARGPTLELLETLAPEQQRGSRVATWKSAAIPRSHAFCTARRASSANARAAAWPHSAPSLGGKRPDERSHHGSQA